MVILYVLFNAFFLFSSLLTRVTRTLVLFHVYLFFSISNYSCSALVLTLYFVLCWFSVFVLLLFYFSHLLNRQSDFVFSVFVTLHNNTLHRIYITCAVTATNAVLLIFSICALSLSIDWFCGFWAAQHFHKITKM